uniref:Conopeptide im021 n=1 Tax=Conus imperialis TaxID=35631 RepID=A0A125S9F5_CONIM|nr:conopeptide im021 [Conus imperialis]
MHLSTASSVALMFFLLFAFYGVQPELMTRDVDNGQLTDNRRNLRSRVKPTGLFKSRKPSEDCGKTCETAENCPDDCSSCLSVEGTYRCA